MRIDEHAKPVDQTEGATRYLKAGHMLESQLSERYPKKLQLKGTLLNHASQRAMAR